VIETVFVAIVGAIAVIVVASLAHHAFMRWLDEKAKLRVQENVLGEVTARQDQLDQMIGKLAIDWRAKFIELENDWKQLKEHADSKYAGAMAQLPTARGFNR
jgi:hypothetical protein